ncbi:DNA polymerase III gamma and tau subunits [Wigglesworthia glossinidia endosymbiont of Glossina morsitans morsitans (Yale colony)]|uniref:DNA polymerase III subunit gamma/tau n=1 Tax=Wigglesworthia glossinidia endosymbiont of Glossina morsitans morsitans (Yale colony) TaxID=1142511 RepID=H6Q4L2_WIGGL|nr:DNA polymerase III subunit gamma/tau [Wigglesworthia glossinidia]AFA41072.1 DNA polymerase III gamma and tau subunits [Wigglesworthia glossinidia endosymbiont of Glossina morsitans morsitans (Yale colony)]
MYYKPLTLKWRPKHFHELIGQHNILKLIENSFLLKRIQSVYLISGIKGIGKTSLARLIAKGLNCKNGITFRPCQSCCNCQEADSNCFIDLIEIDAASYTKIEYIKEVLDTIKYSPSKGRYKIYIIDEVHMLSKYSFNALLKILEEPPLHTKFILATTEIYKIPETIFSRCFHLNLQPIRKKYIIDRLKNILTLENVYYEEYALDLIAQSSQKSMRNALSLTEKALILGNNKILSNLVSKMLGIVHINEIFNLFEALILSNKEQLISFFEICAKKIVNWDDFLIKLLILIHQIILFQIYPNKMNFILKKEKYIRFQKISKKISTNDLHNYYQIFLKGRQELTYAPEQKIAVEMIILRAFLYSIN